MNIDLGLDKFTETISNALGLTAIGIKKNAKAESYASIIKAKTDAEVALIKIQGEEKVAQYLLSRNKQKLENVESIISKAEKQFIPNEPVSDKPVDHDWMNRFLNIAEEISDEDMRNLWAQVLAGEVKKPQSYSLRTLEVLRNMTKSEADLVVKSSKFLLFLDSLSKDDFALEIKDEILLEDIGIVCGEEIVITYKIKKDEKLSLLLNPWHLINICDGDVDFATPVVDGRIDHLVEHPYPVVGRCISDRLEKMLPAGEQRAVIAGGIGTSRGQPFGFWPGVKPPVDKAPMPEVILEMVFGHTSYHDRHFAAHHTVQPVTFPLYHFRKIFYVHNHQ